MPFDSPYSKEQSDSMEISERCSNVEITRRFPRSQTVTFEEFPAEAILLPSGLKTTLHPRPTLSSSVVSVPESRCRSTSQSRMDLRSKSAEASVFPSGLNETLVT